jgi:hypothetical protein
MSDAHFFERPILNSLYEYSRQHWTTEHPAIPPLLARQRRVSVCAVTDFTDTNDPEVVGAAYERERQPPVPD